MTKAPVRKLIRALFPLVMLSATGAWGQAPDVRWTFGAFGSSSYILNSFSPSNIAFGSIGSQDPTLPLEVGKRYEITVQLFQIHPLEILAKGNSAGQDIVLLSMAIRGSFESDPGVGWIEHGGGRVSFTLTEALHTAMRQGGRNPGYRCQPHQTTMRGNFSVAAAPPPPPPPPPPPGPTADVSWTFGNVGNATYRLDAFSPSGIEIGTLGSQNPTLRMELGKRYEVIVTVWQMHPFEVLAKANSASQDIVLLSMIVTGSFESDPDVDWMEHGQGRVSFTLTPELHAAMLQGGRIPGYRCQPHQTTMRGNFSVFVPGQPIVERIGPSPLDVDLLPVATGLTAPVALVADPVDPDLLYIVEQQGVVRILMTGGLIDEMLLDVSDRLVPLGVSGDRDVNDYDERGLLGLAFHPGFADAGSPGYQRLYTYTSEPVQGPADHTVRLPGRGGSMDHQSVVTEWQASDSGGFFQVDIATAREVMRVDQPQFNHDGGHLEFGPDGYLYIALGDGGDANDDAPGHGDDGNGQNIQTVLGSILRIDPLAPEQTPDSSDAASANSAYRIPADNPFVNAPGADEIYAYGLRNPYRFGFDAASGDLIATDVGQDLVEEIDIIVKGGNYGWRLKEGSFLFDPEGLQVGIPLDDPALIDPVAEYDHDEGLSIIGGRTYHGMALPGLYGRYVFGDFSRQFDDPNGRLLVADLETGLIEELLIGPVKENLGLFVKGTGRDAQGELYVLASRALGPYGNSGRVLKIVPLGTRFEAHLRGGPAGTDSTATGHTELRLRADDSRMDYRLSLTDIENVTMAHIHVADTPGGDGPPLIWLYPAAPPPALIPGTFTGLLAEGSISGESQGGSLADLIQAIREDRAYVNVHTQQFPGGEIRSPLVETFTSPAVRNATLSAAAAGTDSTATGHTQLLPNAAGTAIGFRLSVSGLENTTMAHIHVSDIPGGNGSPAVWLFPAIARPGLKPGVFTGILGAGVITAADLTGPLAGQSLDTLLLAIQENRAYVNVHTQQFGGGEIRGQIE